jgi:hypothetical protein
VQPSLPEPDLFGPGSRQRLAALREPPIGRLSTATSVCFCKGRCSTSLVCLLVVADAWAPETPRAVLHPISGSAMRHVRER